MTFNKANKHLKEHISSVHSATKFGTKSNQDIP